MAGPYDGFFLNWEGHHYFYYDPEDPNDRVDLWDRKNGLTTWTVDKFYHWQGDRPAVWDWSKVEPVHMIVRKDGYSDLHFKIRWRE